MQAQAYFLNVTVVPASATAGYLTVYPTGTERPLASTLNMQSGVVVANGGIFQAGGGALTLYAAFPLSDDTIPGTQGYPATRHSSPGRKRE